MQLPIAHVEFFDQIRSHDGLGLSGNPMRELGKCHDLLRLLDGSLVPKS